MANRRYTSQFLYQFEAMPVLLSCNFIVDSANGNGLGQRSLKGEGIHQVYMNVANGAPSGSPALGSARSYGILAASAITNTGASVVSGNLGISPGASVSGFPPGVVSGSENIANGAAASAQSQALAAYNDLHSRPSTTIPTALDGQVLTPGVYSASSGTFSLAASGPGTLTLNGPGVYVFQTASTLVTGAGGIPTILLTGGALAQNVYWVVGSSATINSGNAGTFQGNIIAMASITDTLGGTVNGSMIALTGAVTLSAASNSNAVPLAAGFVDPGNPNPLPGNILVQFSDVYARSLAGGSSIGTPLGVPSSSTVQGSAATIVALGTASLAQWRAVGLPVGVVPSVGISFIPRVSASIGGGAAVSLPANSLIDHIEFIGDSSQDAAAMAYKTPSAPLVNPQQSINGGYQVLACLNASNALTAPADGTVISLWFLLSNSSVTVKGQ